MKKYFLNVPDNSKRLFSIFTILRLQTYTFTAKTVKCGWNLKDLSL